MALGSYEKDIIATPFLNKDEMEKYWLILDDYKNNGFNDIENYELYKFAKYRLIEFNMRLLLRISRQFNRKTGLPIEDLISIGSEAIIDAIERYDLAKGFKPSSFLTSYIENRFKSYVASLVKYNTVEFSLNEPIDEDGEITREESVLSILPLPEDEATFNLLLQDIFSILTEREKDVISRRFGIGTDVCETLQEIGESYGMTREGIRKIEEKALEKIRRKIKL